MFVELIDHLRCPQPHEESPLVAFAEETRNRHVIRGTLGCPLCARRYAIVGGAARFATGAPDAKEARGAPGSVVAGDEWPLRLAAFLDLAEGPGVVGLYGAWARHAEPLGDLAESVEMLAIDAEEATHPMLSAIRPASRTTIPLATGSLRAAAIDERDPAAAAADVQEAARLVRAGGRLLAPAGTPVPHGVRELARDADWWVGERDAAPSGVVSIASRRSR